MAILVLFGIKTVCPNGISEITKGEPIHLSDAEKETIAGNISQNVTSLAKENPEITFYYFFTPYSVIWWKDQVSSGSIYKQIEAEEYIIKMILECDNIKLFSFNNRTDITCDLNNYKDFVHYGQWINSLILRWMHDGEYQITKDNYKSYLEDEFNNYFDMDYYSLNEQSDYESDFYAAALLNQEFTEAQPIDLLAVNEGTICLNCASIVENQYDGTKGIECMGSLQREPGSEISVFDYITNNEYVGASIDVES